MKWGRLRALTYITLQINIRRDIEVGTFASAACGRRSEQKGVAAVKIFARKCEKILGTATGHNGVSPKITAKNSIIKN